MDGGEEPLLPHLPENIPPARPRRGGRRAFAFAVIASMASLIFGYYVAVMSGAQIFIKADLGFSDGEIELLAGAVSAYCLAGSLPAGWTADKIGRRGTIALTAAIFLVSAVTMSVSSSFAVLLAARIVAAVAVGFTCVVVPVYVVEISPAASRGFLTTLPEISVNVGILLSYVANWALAGLPASLAWRLMFAAGIAPAIFLAGMTIVLPESPRWLVMKNRLAEAERVLAATADTPQEAELWLRALETSATGNASNATSGSLWTEIAVRRSASIRRIFVAVLVLQLLQQGSGIDSLVLYSPRVFEAAGIRSNSLLLLATVIVGVVKTAFILVATALSDRAGRRPLLLASAGGMAAAMLTLGALLHEATRLSSAAWLPPACVAVVSAAVAVFSVGLGPVAGAYGAEVLPLRVRAQGVGLASALNRIVSGVVIMTFLTLCEAVTMPVAFFIYAGVAVAGCAFVSAQLPETKGRSLEDIEVLFAK